MDEKALLLEALSLHLLVAECLQTLSIYNINFIVWRQKTHMTLRLLYGVKSPQAQQFLNIVYAENNKKDATTPLPNIKLYQTGLAEAVVMLKNCREKLQKASPMGDTDIKQVIENYIIATAVSDKKKEENLKRFEKVSKYFAQAQKDRISVEIINNQMATFINSIVIENEEELLYGRNILQSAK